MFAFGPIGMVVGGMAQGAGTSTFLNALSQSKDRSKANFDHGELGKNALLGAVISGVVSGAAASYAANASVAANSGCKLVANNAQKFALENSAIATHAVWIKGGRQAVQAEAKIFFA